MSEKRKISVRKLLLTLLTIVLAGACVTGMLSAANLQDKEKVSALNIRIKNARYQFIDTAQIKNMLLTDKHIDISKTGIGRLNLYRMEKEVSTNPWVADAQVYIDNNRVLNVFVTQRIPVARIFDQAGNSYYLDHTLKSMPLSDRYVHYTTVVTNVPVLKDDSMSLSLKAQIVALVKYIDKDSFWNTQISQIIVTDDYQYELVPVLGMQKILLGDTSMLDKKFTNLFAFYKKVMNRVGWDKYKVLDLRYGGQVIASPALPWKPPVDKAVATMNWVKTIIGSDTQRNKAIVDIPAAISLTAKPVQKPVVTSSAKTMVAKELPKQVVAPKHVEHKAEPVKNMPTKKTEAHIVKEKKTETKKPEQKKSTDKETKTPKYIYQGH